MEIQVVRFRESIHLGKQLDLLSALAQDQAVLGDPVKLSWYNDVFLRVDFTKGKYSQLIPWASVAGVLFQDTKAPRAANSTK